MRSPIVAMLWENWRLTRVEAALRMAVGLIGGAGAFLFDNGATVAFWILIATHALFFFSIAKLNGGRFLDGYKPGFPFYLLYPRPVRTVVLVGVAMAYDAIVCTAMYLVSAALLGFAFGQPIPLFSVVPWILASHLAYAGVQWSTRSRVAQWIGSIALGWPAFFMMKTRVASPLHVEFSLTENAAMILIGLVMVGLAVAGVARQRCGDAIASAPRAARAGGYPDWLVGWFRFSCPTSSPTKAQVWFELKSSGLPVLVIGLAVAMLIFLLFALGIPVAPARHAAVSVAFLAVPAVVILLGGNAFGIRRRQGRAYVSAFEMTHPQGIAQLATIKLLVRTGCVLFALIVIGVSLWASSALLSEWGTWMPDGKKDAVPGLLKLRGEFENTFGAAVFASAAQLVLLILAVVLAVASFATFAALRARYPRRLLVAGALLLLSFVVLLLLVLAVRSGILSGSLLNAIGRTTGWIVAAATVCAAGYLLWSGFTERALTVGYVCGALAISAAFAWGCLPAPGAAAILASWLLPLIACLMAPWALGRLRHT